MERYVRQPATALFNAYLPPPRGRGLSWRAREPGGDPQDYQHYAWADFARRRRTGAVSWRDLYPAYVFARISHRADWPRGADDTEAELAALWEQARGASRWAWPKVRPVVEDAWQALDRMPSAAVHGARQ